MRCYKCEEFGWDTEEEIVEIQNDNRGLCLFHQMTDQWSKGWGEAQGTRKLHQDLLDKRIPDEAKREGLKRIHSPESIAKAIASKREKSASPLVLEALNENRKRPKSKAWKEKARKSMQRQWAEGKRKHPQAWSDKELALLGTDSDEVVAEKIGRTVNAVAVKRRRYKIKSF